MKRVMMTIVCSIVLHPTASLYANGATYRIRYGTDLEHEAPIGERDYTALVLSSNTLKNLPNKERSTVIKIPIDIPLPVLLHMIAVASNPTRQHRTEASLNDDELTSLTTVADYLASETIYRACIQEWALRLATLPYLRQAVRKNWVLTLGLSAPVMADIAHELLTVSNYRTQPITTLTGSSRSIITLAYSPNSRLIAAAPYDNSLRIWNALDDNVLRRFSAHTSDITTIAYAPDGREVASGSTDKQVILWQVNRGTYKRLLGHAAPLVGVTYSPDGRSLVSASDDGVIIIWDSQSGALIRRIHDNHLLLAIAHASKTPQLAASAIDNTIRIWNTNSGKMEHELSGHTDYVRALAYSPDGTRLASGSDDGTILVWNTTTFNQQMRITAHKAHVYSLAFSPDGTRIASASDDGTIKLWDSATGSQITTLHGGYRSVYGIAYSPNGNYLAAGTNDGSVAVWLLKTSSRNDLDSVLALMIFIKRNEIRLNRTELEQIKKRAHLN